MPREYQIKPGTPSPSPMQFGSADINLQTPRFVAQTNVAPSENPFESLQRILGLATDIVGLSITGETRNIEGKINYQLAVQKQQDRQEAAVDRAQVEKRRAESEAAAAWEAEARYKIASAKTPDEATKIAEESLRKTDGESAAMTASRAQVVMAAKATARQLQSEVEGNPKDREEAIKYESETRLKIAKATSASELDKIKETALNDSLFSDTPIMATSRAQIVAAADARKNQLEGKTDQAGLDNRKAILSEQTMRIQNAFEAGNDKDLLGLSKTFAKKAADSKDPDEKAIWNTLRDRAYTQYQQINNNIDQANLKEERASAIKAAELTTQLAEPIVNGYAADLIETYKLFEGFSDESLAAAMFDSVRDKILKENKELAALWDLSDSEMELAAVSEAIKRSIDPVLKAMISKRNRENEIKAQELTINSYAQQAKDLGFDEAYVRATSVDVLEETVQRRTVREITKAAIDSKETDIDKINEASRIISTYGNTDASIQAVKMRKEATDRISNTINLEHQSLLNQADTAGPTFPVDDVAVGWRTKFPDKDSFFKWILESKLGVDITTFQNSPELQSIFGPMLTKYGAQFDEDSSKTDVNIRRQDTEFKRNEAAQRKTMTVEQGWKASPLYSYMNGNSSAPYGSLQSDAVEELVRDALVGYTDNSIPSDLMEAVKKNIGDERNYPLIQAFWKVMQTNPNATVKIAVSSDPAMFDSWALGQYLNYQYGRERTAATVNAKAKDFMANIQAYKKPDNGTEKFKASQEIRTQVIAEMTGGAGIDTGWWDFTGISPDQVIKNMAPADQSFFIELSGVAAALPEESRSFLSSMMQSNGYRIYPVTTENNETVFRMLNPYQTRPDVSTQGLPEPSEFDTQAWFYYLLSKKPLIAEALSKRQPVGGAAYTYRPDEITMVEISPTNYDLQLGVCCVKAKVGNSWKILGRYEVSLTAQDFYTFKKTFVMPKADMVEVARAAAFSGM